jgi:hypothetical protein
MEKIPISDDRTVTLKKMMAAKTFGCAIFLIHIVVALQSAKEARGPPGEKTARARAFCPSVNINLHWSLVKSM